MGLFYSSFALDGRTLWLLAGDFPILCKMNLDTMIIEYVTELTDKSCPETDLYSKILKIEDKLYCLPNKGNHIAIFDIKSKCLRHEPLIREGEATGNGVFGSAFCDGEYIYCIGNLWTKIVKYSIKTNETQVVETGSELPLWKVNSVYDQKIFIPHAPYVNSNEVIIYDIEKNRVVKQELDFYGGISGIVSFGDKIYASSVDHHGLYELSYSNDMLNVVRHVWENPNYAAAQSTYVFRQNGLFWMFPWKANELVAVNENGERIYSLDYDSDDDIKYIYADVIDNSHIAGFYKYGKSFDILDTRTGKIEKYENAMPKGIDYFLKQKIESNAVLHESGRKMNLEILINAL